MGKIKTLAAYLDEHEFLKETAEFHFKLEEKFLPRNSAEKILRQENLSVKKFCAEKIFNETLTRKNFWVAVDKFIPAELKLWERDDRQENYCPICGRRPVIAHLKKLNEGRA